MIKIKQVLGLTVAGALMVGLGGCGSRLLKVDPTTLSKPQKVAIVWSVENGMPRYTRTGQGLLDMAVSEITKAPWIKNIETFNLNPLVKGEFDRLWKPVLVKSGIDYQFVETPVNLQSFRLKTQKENQFWADGKAIVGASKADYLVVFEVRSIEVVHDHSLGFGIVALSKPTAEFTYKLTVIRTSDNQIVGEGSGDKKVTMEDGWDKGPEYSGIYKAMVTAFSTGMEDIYKSVIGE